MEIETAGKVRILPSVEPESYYGPRLPCRAFYLEGGDTLYYLDKKDNISLPGMARAYAHNFFYDVFIQAAMRDLLRYFEEHKDDTDYFRSADFWTDAFRYAGRSIVPHSLFPRFSRLKEERIDYCTWFFGSEHRNGAECYLDLASGQIVLDIEKDTAPRSLAEYFYGECRLTQMLAQRKHEEGLAPMPYGEICRINEFLEDKRIVKIHYPDGFNCHNYRRKNMHAGELLKIEMGKIIPNTYNYKAGVFDNIGLPQKYTHRSNEFLLDHAVLSALDVDLTPEQQQKNEREEREKEFKRAIPKDRRVSFSYVKMEAGYKELKFYTPVTGIDSETIHDVDEAEDFIYKHCTEDKISVEVEVVTLGSGEDGPMPDDLMERIKQRPITCLIKYRGYNSERTEFSFDAEQLCERYGNDPGQSEERRRVFLAGKIRRAMVEGLGYKFCEITVWPDTEKKQMYVCKHLEYQEDVAELSLLRRMRYRNPDEEEFSVRLRNITLNASHWQKTLNVSEELLEMIKEYGVDDCINDMYGWDVSQYFLIDARDIPLDQYKQKRLDRIERLEERAGKAVRESNALFERSHKMIEHIPPGQPILVGHHSEARHRRDLDRSWNTLGRAVAAGEKADYYASKAVSAKHNTAISSDDPDALEELREKRDKLVAHQEYMKAANKYHRKHGTLKGFDNLSDEKAAECDKAIESSYSFARQPFPSFKLTNNNANIRRIEGRIRELEAREENPISGWDFDGGTVVANEEINRLQIFFDEVPEKEFRQRLHRYHSFNFSRAEGNAWQRQLNRNAVHAAKQALEEFAQMNKKQEEQENPEDQEQSA